ncbi:MAG: MaoC/PaaZ C-terminal domain-containing protein, partial [Candidatus Dadabacteria bacterium]|nr:MaoC/PaaZ C-terminal domain-containing protein [Candidatus Dadabacteria bacterium]
DNSRASIRMAPPSFSVTYELPMIYELLSDVELHGGEEQAKKNMLMLVHGEQHMKFYKPLRPGDEITCRAKITDIEDKGSGELLKINAVSTISDGARVVESDWGLFIRGIGSGQRPLRKKEEPKVLKPSTIAFRKVIRVPEDITYRYSKASNDMNPIHLDNEVAKKAGLSGIIVHGLCTMSMTMQGIIEAYLDSEPSNLLSLGVRFSAPVYPGDELIVDGWESGSEDSFSVLGFDVTRKSDGKKVIKDGKAEVKV